jgi:flagellar assembly protein FliH
MSARLIKQEKNQLLAFVPLSLPSTDGAGQSAHTGMISGSPVPGLQQSAPLIQVPHEDHTLFEELNGFTDLSEDEATEQAATIISEAQAEAERLVMDAQSRVAQIEQEARERGLLEGRANASKEVGEAIELLRERFTATLEELHDLRSALAVRAERDLVRLALELARKVVQREVTIDPEIALTLTRVALSRIHNRASATIHLNPDDFAFVNSQREHLHSSGTIEIVQDRSITRGGCLIETNMGDVDARIEQQFAEIERGFLGQ